MAAEIEAKFWLEKPSKKTVKTLGIEQIIEYDIKKLRKKARKISGSKPTHKDLLDHYYYKESKKGITLNKLNKKVKLDLESGLIKYGKAQSLKVTVEGDNDLTSEFQGFKDLLLNFFSAGDFSNQTARHNSIRIREDRVQNAFYLTMKCKHGKADEDTEEYEFRIDSKKNGEAFLKELGYVMKPHRTKQKTQEKYSFRQKEIEFHIEINGIDRLDGARFLEIEAVPKSLEESPGIDAIYALAKKLGIKDSDTDVSLGGNLENRPYGMLMALSTNRTRY